MNLTQSKMAANNSINTYYQKIIDLVLELYQVEFSSASQGHCMKITGLGINEVEYFWDILNSNFKNISSFIVSDDNKTDVKYISATKLIELRNKQESPLLVLIPSNSRTAAEDSYGNATFKEISLIGIELELKNKLLTEIPDPYSRIIKEDILNYLGVENFGTIEIINYLIALEKEGFNNENIGNFIFFLNLIPDSHLINEVGKTRSRLNFNLKSIELLSSFNRPIYDRIKDLPLESNTLQKELVQFFKEENKAKSVHEICRSIFEKYPNLNFSKWNIPDLDFNHIKLIVEEIKSTNFKIEEGTKVLHTEGNNVSKVKIKFSTMPPPKDISELKYFRIILMAVDGGAGEEISVVRKLKNTNSNRPYREATIELNPNQIEEGSYFFKVMAEDENGIFLNADDDFKDLNIQKEWIEAKEKDSNYSKSNLNYKLTCDSEDFDYVIDEEIERPENQRKDKLNNVLQAYFRYRIEKLKNDQELDIPIPSDTSNIWLNDKKLGHTSTFHINYSEKHNYQINLSSKLRIIEDKFLFHSDSLGYVQAQLKNYSSATGFESCNFIESELTGLIPNSILKHREAIFELIRYSNQSQNGVFETADIFKFYKKIKSYISKYTEWTSDLKSQISSKDLSSEEKGKLQHFLTELQILDVAKIKTKLPDGHPVEALLLSPLHPLRLSWTLQLLEVFNQWENKTISYGGYKDSWTNNLENLFDGALSPKNSPLVLVEPNSFKNYHYSGELQYGWGLYLNVLNEESKNGMTSISRQLMYYFRQLFNITTDNYVETDVSQKLIIRHIKNYLIQHPYIEKLIINLINAGDANVFANSFVQLEKEHAYKNIKYEIRIFKGNDRIIEHGQALKNLINPETNITEEAEAFSQPSKNRLFPKLRFSINNINDYLKFPSKYTAHLSFIISPFPIQIELIKPHVFNRNFYLNALLTDSTVSINENGNEIKWNRYILGNKLPIEFDGAGKTGITLFENIQSFIGGALASRYTDSIPSTQLRLNDKDKVLLSHLHDYSDWVITFDKNLGPQIYDQPSKEDKVPFLLDYIPGEEISGISSYLTTRPTSEILGLLGPHFEEFNINIFNIKDEKKIKILLEDLRAVSSSLVLQLNSSKNKAFEVIGTAFTKRVLEKKGFLEEAFLIPIDLHQNLFENQSNESKSRADNLLVSMNTNEKEISFTVIEIKCRKSIGEAEKDELKNKMKEQIQNTIETLKIHFDPEYHLSFDRLDREIKNKELKSLLGFYLDRAHRYEYLNPNTFNKYSEFIQKLDEGFKFKFKQLGLIYDFSASKSHHKEVIDSELTFFTFGRNLVEEILNPDSDLNTRRLEEKEFEDELSQAIGIKNVLKPFIQKFKPNEIDKGNEDNIETGLPKNSSRISDNIETQQPTEDVLILDGYIKDESRDNNEEIILGDDSDLSKDESPQYDILIGKGSSSAQFGILGESIHGKKIAIDLSETNTISLFGVQGGGKSYTIGTITEMVLKQFRNINKLPSPFAGVIFHYSESMDYEPEFTSMIYPNDKEDELEKLRVRYGAYPENIKDVILLTPKDKIEERQADFPSITVLPIAFNSTELNVQDWMFLLGAIGNDSTYIKQLKAIMKENRRNLTLDGISESVETSELLSNTQKALARQKLSFAREYIDDTFLLREKLRPGRLIIVDLRDEFIVKDEALGLFVIMLNIFSGVRAVQGTHFNKFIVFDEAHKYMDNKDLTGNIVNSIREMRHKGVSIMIASQDPPSLPNEIIELSSIVLMHKFNSPLWLKHIQKSVTQLNSLTPADMSILNPGEGFLWATKATDKSVSTKPIKVSTRPRVTKHGGGTIQATGN